MRRLSRETFAGVREPDPVRIVHIGPGAFHRAHQAWYTEHAGDRWGIAAVCARSSRPLEELGQQGGLYSLFEHHEAGWQPSVVQSISSVEDAAESSLVRLLASPAVSVVTLTVTETGYAPSSHVIKRLALGLAERLRHDVGPIACCSLDNLPSNGKVLERAIKDALAETRPQALSSLDEQVSFPSSVVDRITPRPTAADRARAAAWLGLEDWAVVATEAYSEWAFEDRFPAGRPAWERGGGRPVEDVGGFGLRKLRFLNAGHSALAYLGALAGHRTVDEAIADGTVALHVEGLFDEATRALGATADGLGLEAYCKSLRVRWSDRIIAHELTQIAEDGVAKLSVRLAPTVTALRTRSMPHHCVAVVAAFWDHLRGCSGMAISPSDEAVARRCQQLSLDSARALLGALQPELADDGELAAAVLEESGRSR